MMTKSHHHDRNTTMKTEKSTKTHDQPAKKAAAPSAPDSKKSAAPGQQHAKDLKQSGKPQR
jgi:hypothetical protein